MVSVSGPENSRDWRGGGASDRRPTSAGLGYETIQAEFDPSKSNGKTAVFSPDGSNAVRQYQDMVQVAPNEKQEKLGFLVPTPGGGLVYKAPSGFSAYSRLMPDNATGTPPADAVYGMHGHIPGRADGFVDAPESNSGYGDASALGLSVPVPIATIARMNDGTYALGLHEIVNGRLQIRAPIGSLSDAQRQRIQQNLNREQKKFYR